MKKLTIENIINITGGNLLTGNNEEICINFSKDTRTIKNGDIYIGIKGEKFDGNLFWKEALEKGAKGVILQNVKISEEEINKYVDKNIIIVENTLEALYKIASYKRDLYEVPVIAITGSVGKTSTKDIVANVVSQKYKTLKTIANHNNNIGLSFTILNAHEDIEAMVLEMGMNHFGEIDLLSKIAKPNICIITNIGTSHIGNLGSRENILKAKLEILNGAKNPYIIVNNDNDLLHKWAIENKEEFKIKTYGIKKPSDVQPSNVIVKEDKSQVEIQIRNQENIIEVPVGGEHFVLNSLCAIEVGILLNIKNEEIKNGIETFKLTKNRMDIKILKNQIKIINDAYNASVESVEAIIKYVQNIEANRRIAVLGDIFEVGKYSKEIHEKIGEIVCKNNIDILICSGENAKYIVNSAKEKGFKKENVYYLEDKEEIVELIKKIVQPQDLVIFKASNGMKFYDIAEKVKTELE
ncbi:MAG: UDP-N-acetylmuramoyl-tripeptide--D-alanyl-D-alanine ligase [Clostridia bacterium]